MRLGEEADLVFPARAGMIPEQSGLFSSVLRIPRESGDDPAVDVVNPRLYRYSPRERG